MPIPCAALNVGINKDNLSSSFSNATGDIGSNRRFTCPTFLINNGYDHVVYLLCGFVV
jgi:hypothetical protein